MEDSVVSAQDWDQAWTGLNDFIAFHPGAKHRRRIICEIAQECQPSTVLDVGCGTGLLIKELHDRLPNSIFTGADFSAQTLQSNQQKYDFVRFVTLDLEQECLSEKFDLIICSEVLEHLNQLKPAFANLAAMLKQEGYLLVTTPTGKIFDTEKYFGHVYHPTKTDFLNLATEFGLTVRFIHNWGWPVYKLQKLLTNFAAQQAMQKFATGSYNCSQKLISTLLYYLNKCNLRDCDSGVQLICLFQKVNRV